MNEAIIFLHDLNLYFCILESLSSIALLDSKILAPPDDPDDIFGMGDHWKSSANGMHKSFRCSLPKM